MRRGVKEALVAVAALPVLLAVGVYVGGRIGNGPSTSPRAVGAAATITSAPRPGVSPRPSSAPSPAEPPVVTTKPVGPVASARSVGPVASAAPPAAPPAAPRAAPPAPIAPPPPSAPGPAIDATPLGPVAPATPPAAPPAVLGRGSVGADVRTWQQQMSRRGWRIAVDGIFGPQTQSVARRFQREKGLRPDGLVGRRTWAAAWRRPVTR
jgi:peptidoglycan hydrolase-like protein with peptidoglycan-binding domain